MPFQLDYFNKLILVTSPQVTATVQDLSDFIEDQMAAPEGLVSDGINWDFKGDVARPEGKLEDAGNPGVFTQIILAINPDWQIQFWGGSGYTRITGGKMIGGLAGEVMKATGTAGDITVLETQVDGTFVSAGSGMSVSESLQLQQVHGQVVRCVFVDTEQLVNGTFGYQQDPFNNWSDAVDYAETNNLKVLKIQADANLDRNLANFTVEGVNLPTIDLSGFTANNLIITQCSVTGAQGVGQSPLLLLTCNVGSITDFNGSMLTVSVVGGIGIADGAFCLINEIVPTIAGAPFTLDMQTGAAGSTVQVQNISGGVVVTNMDHADDVLHLGFIQGQVTIAASCTAGALRVNGPATVINNSAGTTVVVSGKEHEIWTRLDLDPNNPTVYALDGTSIVNNDFTLTKTPTGVTVTIQRS